MGRASKYTQALGDEICSRLAEGESLNSICKAEHLPDEKTVRTWAIDPEHPFSPKYARAREVGYIKMADDLLDIADDATNDFMVRKKGDDGEEIEVVNHDHIARSRLRVETRKWMLAKVLPKIFGDKAELNVTADHKHTHVTEPVSETAEWIEGMLGGRAGRKAAKSLPN